MPEVTKTFLARLAVYSIVAVAVTLIWTNWAETERPAPFFENHRWYESIVGIEEGSAPPPFVKRRLLPDAARLLAAAVPRPVWEGVAARVEATPIIAHRIRDAWYWRNPDDWPLLMSATFLLFCAIVAYAFAAETLIAHYLRPSDSVRLVMTVLVTAGLLGGGGDHHYGWYPYDFPIACLFAWLLIAIEFRKCWTLPVFALAAYCKETAVFLVVLQLAYAAVSHRRWHLLQAGLCAVAFAAIQTYLSWQYHAPPLQDRYFWFDRNVRLIVYHLVFSSWKVAVLSLVVLRVAVLWPKIPIGLRLTTILVPCFLAAAMVKGWIEEYRQYTELILPLMLVAGFCIRVELSVLRLRNRHGAGRTEREFDTA